MAAATLIEHIVEPDVFAAYVIERTAELSALWSSGIVAPVPELGIPDTPYRGGRILNMPFWQDLTGEDEVLDDSTALTPAGITTAQDVCRALFRGRAWSANDLAGTVAGDDPMAAIGNLVAAWWARRMQACLLATLTGVFASSSMSGAIHDISDEDGDKAVIGAETTLDALQLLGDASSRLTGFAMHSAAVTKLKKLDLVDVVPASEQGDEIVSYMGKRIVVDDGLPVTEGVYTSYIFGAGAIGYDETLPRVPVETERNALAGDEILVMRRHFVLHPRGVAWQEQVCAGVSPSNAELANGTNWELVYEQKNVRLVQFVHRVEEAEA